MTKLMADGTSNEEAAGESPPNRASKGTGGTLLSGGSTATPRAGDVASTVLNGALDGMEDQVGRQDRYRTVTGPLQGLTGWRTRWGGRTVTGPLQDRYRAVAGPLQYRYRAVTGPLTNRLAGRAGDPRVDAARGLEADRGHGA